MKDLEVVVEVRSVKIGGEGFRLLIDNGGDDGNHVVHIMDDEEFFSLSFPTSSIGMVGVFYAENAYVYCTEYGTEKHTEKLNGSYGAYIVDQEGYKGDVFLVLKDEGLSYLE